MSNGVNIYFENLDEETQEKILDEAGIDDPKEANWDTFPLFVFKGFEK